MPLYDRDRSDRTILGRLGRDLEQAGAHARRGDCVAMWYGFERTGRER